MYVRVSTPLVCVCVWCISTLYAAEKINNTNAKLLQHTHTHTRLHNKSVCSCIHLPANTMKNAPTPESVQHIFHATSSSNCVMREMLYAPLAAGLSTSVRAYIFYKVCCCIVVVVKRVFV